MTPSRSALLSTCLFVTPSLRTVPYRTWPLVSREMEFVVSFCCVACPLTSLQDRQVPELITATGSGHLGAFHLFQVCTAFCTFSVGTEMLHAYRETCLHVLNGSCTVSEVVAVCGRYRSGSR